MAITNSNTSYSGLVQKYIGTAYDTVKLVADNLDGILAIDVPALTIIAEEVEADRVAAELAATNAGVSETNAGISADAADVSDIAASASAVLADTEAAASLLSASQSSDSADDSDDSKLGSGSWSDEDEDVPVQGFTDGVGTDLSPTKYSAKHYAAKALIAAGPLDDAPLDGLHYGRNNGAWEKGVAASNYIGKNILINGDNSITQRGDYSTATVVANDKYYLDRWKVNLQNVSGTIQRELLYQTDGTYSQKIVATSADALGGFQISQHIENAKFFLGKTVTFTVRVKSNRAIFLSIADGFSSVISTAHTGDGQYQTLSVTYTIHNVPTIDLYVTLNTHNGSPDQVDISDYCEILNQQLELGSVFTGFEIVPPAIQLANCQRYYQILFSELTYEALPFFFGFGSNASSPIKIPPMRIALPAITGNPFPTLSISPSAAFTSISALSATDSDARKGKVVLQLSGTFTVGTVYYVNKDNNTDPIGLDAEI